MASLRQKPHSRRWTAPSGRRSCRRGRDPAPRDGPASDRQRAADDGNHWHPARNGYLVPIRALANLVRGKLRAALTKRRPNLTLPKAAWAKPWVVDCTAWGEGEETVLRYLARYVFRVAITNSRIVGLDDKGVTIRHKDRKSMQWRTTRLSGHEFMRRFLQHVLPKGLHKVRYYGLWHPARREHAQRARLMLLLDRPATRLQPHDPPRRLTVPLIGRLIMYHPTKPVFARAISRAVSFAPPAFTPNRQTDHDPYCFAATIITAVVPACSGHATAALCLPFASLCLVVLESPASASDYPHLIA
jgi:hypothetical protein